MTGHEIAIFIVAMCGVTITIALTVFLSTAVFIAVRDMFR